jgi:PBP1b-binding outer membrane lipoprotein LpoB
MKKRIAGVMLAGFLLSGCSGAPEEKQYTIDEATDNGDTVVNEEGKVENLDKLLLFIKDVKAMKQSELTLSNFSNRQVSLNKMKFDGSSLTYELTDGKGDERTNTTCTSIEERSGSISLQGCGGDSPIIGLVQVSEYQINKTRASLND